MRMSVQFSGFTKLATAASVVGLLAIGLVLGCNSGDTDGGLGKNDAEIGTQYVSDGGSGSTLTLDFESDTLGVADTMGFTVTALDPRGAPLSFIRIFCETEHGIAIIEPSSGGVAFEHTNTNGIMSGVIGGVTPGSYLMECRAPQGFNLVVRKSLRITGEVPEGFDGFPGAAGGNLGGGFIVDPPEQDFFATAVSFTDIRGEESSVGIIDSTFTTFDCNNDGTSDDKEPFGNDTYKINVTNNREDRVFVKTVQFEVDDGRGVKSPKQNVGLSLLPGGTGTIIGEFTDFPIGTSNDKYYAGTSFKVDDKLGTFNVTFTIEAETGSGEDVEFEIGATITVSRFNQCEL